MCLHLKVLPRPRREAARRRAETHLCAPQRLRRSPQVPVRDRAIICWRDKAGHIFAYRSSGARCSAEIKRTINQSKQTDGWNKQRDGEEEKNTSTEDLWREAGAPLISMHSLLKGLRRRHRRHRQQHRHWHRHRPLPSVFRPLTSAAPTHFTFTYSVYDVNWSSDFPVHTTYGWTHHFEMEIKYAR